METDGSASRLHFRYIIHRAKNLMDPSALSSFPSRSPQVESYVDGL